MITLAMLKRDFLEGWRENFRIIGRLAWRVHTWANQRAYAIERVLEDTQTGRLPPFVYGRGEPLQWRAPDAPYVSISLTTPECVPVWTETDDALPGYLRERFNG